MSERTLLNTVESLHAYLDAHPADASARLALADALREAGDPDAADCFEWLGLRGKRPVCARDAYEWLTDASRWKDSPQSRLPWELFWRLDPSRFRHWPDVPAGPIYLARTRRAAEEALVQAWRLLPAPERDRLLSEARSADG